MQYQRRNFLKTAGVLGAGLATGSLGALLPGCKTAASASKEIQQRFGLQLYTLRDVLPADPKGILKQVASFGYKEIESYEGDQGMFWGLGHTGFKSLMDELGMMIVASHCDIDKDFEQKAEQAAAIGMKYLICPYLGPQKKLDDYKKAAEKFNQRGSVCKKHGLRFAYHNHDYSFVQLEGQFPQDVMMQGTDKELVDFEMDIYWVVSAGQDPITWLNKYPDRFRLSHIKDRKKGAPSTDLNASTIVGSGSIAFADILGAASKKGMTHFLVEQEAYEGTTPLEAVKANAEYMKSLTVKS